MPKSVRFLMRSEALKGKTGETEAQYKKDIDKFCSFASSKGIKTAGDLEKVDKIQLVQDYSTYLQGATWGKSERHYSTATIKKYVEVARIGLKIAPDIKIDRPVVHAAESAQGRISGRNLQGQMEQKNERYKNLIDFAKIAGLRKSEIAKITSVQRQVDVTGSDCLRVVGKGGKIQYQHILPRDRETIDKIFNGKSKFVFDKTEIKTKINLHTFRREHAKELYRYYLAEIKAGKENELRRDLRKYFEAYHPRGKNYEKQRANFEKELSGYGGIYSTRGVTREVLIKNGLPTEYNRLAIMAVSVFHLAHWRADVTISSYMR